MSKRILVTVDEPIYRRFRVLAAQKGTTNSGLLVKLLDCHTQLLEFQHRELAPTSEADLLAFERLISSPPGSVSDTERPSAPFDLETQPEGAKDGA